MIPTLSTQFFEYLDHLTFDAVLPEGIGLLNPMEGNEMVRKITRQFYDLYYNDHHNRTPHPWNQSGQIGRRCHRHSHLQIPNDWKEKCGLELGDLQTHEPHLFLCTNGSMPWVVQQLFTKNI
ncbi:MAG: hypothetical protein IPP37_07125 [Saprospiraceae bacterium]|nr:hypothetical protein [Saprospiraceae bacterium]